MSSRYEAPFQITLDPDQVTHLISTPDTADREQLRVRIDGEAVTATFPANDTFDHPPSFAGRTEQHADEVHLVGTIREAWASMMWAWLWRVPTFLMLAVAVGGLFYLIMNKAHDPVPLVLGTIATIVFALMWRWMRSQRTTSFRSDTAKLTTGLENYAASGDRSRPGL